MRHEWATLIDKDKNRLLSDKLDLHGVKKKGFVLVRVSLCLICCLVHDKRLKTYFLELFIEISQ